MNRVNPNGVPGTITDESEDLIAELARIVARDAHASRQDIKPEPPKAAAPMPQAPAPRPKAAPATNNPNDILAEGFRAASEPKLQAPQPTAPQVQAPSANVRPLRPADLGLVVDTHSRPTQPQPATRGSAELLDFDFLSGVTRQPPPPQAPQKAAAKVPAKPAHDPIAALINASYGAMDDEPEAALDISSADIDPSDDDEPHIALPAKSDRFESSPALRSSSPSRSRPMDPLDEIERLIAETAAIEYPTPVRAAPVFTPKMEPRAAPQVGAPAQKAPQQSVPAAQAPAKAMPAAPSRMEPELPDFDLPELADYPEIDHASAEAEAAILASVSASVAHETNQEPEQRTPRQFNAARFTAGLGKTLVPVAALLVLAVAGGGTYWYFSNNGMMFFGDPPVVTAQSETVKEPAPEADPTADSILFQQIGETQAALPAGEQIVSRDETATTPTEDLTRIITPESDIGLANRKVRTVTVRPDGTIVTSDQATAGVEPLPELRPNVPEVPGAPAIQDGDADTIGAVLNQIAAEEQGFTPTPAETQPLSSALLPTEPTGAQTTASAPIPVPRPDTGVAAATTSVATPSIQVAPVQQATAPTTITVQTQPVPDQRVAVTQNPNAPVSLLQGTQPLVIAPVSSPATRPTQTASIPTQSSGTSAPYYVQLSSQRSADAARSTMAEITRLYGNILGGTELQVQLVDLGDRGIFYRVKAPAASAADANDLCNRVKAAGGDCFVRAD